MRLLEFFSAFINKLVSIIKSFMQRDEASMDNVNDQKKESKDSTEDINNNQKLDTKTSDHIASQVKMEDDYPSSDYSESANIQAAGIINRINKDYKTNIAAIYPDVHNPVDILKCAVRDGNLEKEELISYAKAHGANIIEGLFRPICEEIKQSLEKTHTTLDVIIEDAQQIKEDSGAIRNHLQEINAKNYALRNDMQEVLSLLREQDQSNNLSEAKGNGHHMQ